MSSLTLPCPTWFVMVARCGTRMISWRRLSASFPTAPTPPCTMPSSRTARSTDSLTGLPLATFPMLDSWPRRPRSTAATTRPLRSPTRVPSSSPTPPAKHYLQPRRHLQDVPDQGRPHPRLDQAVREPCPCPELQSHLLAQPRPCPRCQLDWPRPDLPEGPRHHWT